jgi:hypothetical protein
MKIGLLDVDGHHFPNLALMKLAAYHKRQGDDVEWVNHFEYYDKVYKSKVFTFTPDDTTAIQADEVIKGGTGYGMYSDLFCDDTEPDYSIYPQYVHAYGFLTRGCIRSCPWCIVPAKEGKIRAYRDIETVLQDRKSAVLMDNNILAHTHGLQQLEKITIGGWKVDCNQGLDARLVTNDIAVLLSKVKWIKFIRFACDTTASVDPLVAALDKLNKCGVKNYRVFVYMLVKDLNDAIERSKILKKLGVCPFAQPYRDFNTNKEPSNELKQFARYVNHKAIFNSIEWNEYKR